MPKPLQYGVAKILRLSDVQYNRILEDVEVINGELKKKYTNIRKFYTVKTNASEYIRAVLFPDMYPELTIIIKKLR